jgi:hypothetical protein
MGAQIPPAASERDEDVLDAVAIIAAVREPPDREALSFLFREADHPGVIAAMAKLLAEVLDEQAVSPEAFRSWAIQAARRST